jgi:hypothetical protein
MTRTLAWIAIVWALLAFAFLLASSWIVQQKYKYKFGDFLNEEGIREVVEAEINAMRPSLIIAAVHQTACLITGIGLLRKRPWARPTWLMLCWIGLGVVLLSAVWSGFQDPRDLVPIVVRVLLLVWSIRVLGTPTAREEFSTVPRR